jgi:hypothetical protein
MSPGELVWRAGDRASSAVRSRRPLELLPAGVSWADAYRGFREAVGRPVLLDPQRAAALAAALPAEVDAVIAAADAAVEHRFVVFEQEPVIYPDAEIDWNVDARSGLRWPLVRSTAIDHRTVRGDPKWIWELNRLQHLPWLAQAWLFTGDRRYADAALDQLDSWIRQNPPGRGIAWRGGFEAGVRAISVAIALQGLRTAPGLDQLRYRRVLTMLAASAELAWRHRSRFSSANNHLLGEMAGVATVALLHPELARSSSALDRSLLVLAEEAPRQVLPDGAGAEQSSAYQIFATELMLVPAALLTLSGSPSPRPLLEALRRSVGYLRALGPPLPRYGDEDGGFGLRLHADLAPRADRLFAAVEAVLDGPPATPVDLAAAWLGGVREPRRRPPESASDDLYAADGGLVVLRRGRRRVTMDVGPLGYLGIAAHGHADALAVTLAFDGREVIGDPGTGSYYAEPEWRSAFRGTRMHATVAVDDTDQSVPGGAFLWVRHAATTVRLVDLRQGLVEAEHNGYTRLSGPVTHRRYLIVGAGQDTVVVDLLTGSGVHRVRTSWPLSPDLDARIDGGVHIVERDAAPVLWIAAAGSRPGDPWAVRGDEQRRLGWWSPRFECRVPAWLIGTVVEDARPPLAVVTVLATADIAAPPEVRLHDEIVEAAWISGSEPVRLRIDTRTPGAVTWKGP